MAKTYAMQFPHHSTHAQGSSMKLYASLWLLAAGLCSAAFADAGGPAGPELALDYTYVRPNAPPDVCGCFSMNGGSLSFAQPFSGGPWSAVFDATVVHGAGISAGNFDLTLSVFTLGARYRPWPQSSWSPFGQVLLGAAHASGTLVQGDTPAAQDGSLRFASTVGGGIDYRINRRWSIRVFEADYLLTTYSNRTDDRQNNLRISVGAAFHFGAP
jgi:peptidoglycan-associated lipoprotein